MKRALLAACNPWLHRARLSIALLTSWLLLAGCYPDRDWRKLSSEEGRFQMLMPARWPRA